MPRVPHIGSTEQLVSRAKPSLRVCLPFSIFMLIEQRVGEASELGKGNLVEEKLPTENLVQ